MKDTVKAAYPIDIYVWNLFEVNNKVNSKDAIYCSFFLQKFWIFCKSEYEWFNLLNNHICVRMFFYSVITYVFKGQNKDTSTAFM